MSTRVHSMVAFEGDTAVGTPTTFQGNSPWNNYLAALANKAFTNNPIPLGELIKNIDLFVPNVMFARGLFLADVYARVTAPGSLIEFGVRWGHDLVTLQHLRGLDGHRREIIGFDTFTGHAGSTEVDGDSEHVEDGAFDCPPGYAEWLSDLLAAHGKHTALVTGDVRETLPKYLTLFPETTVALAILDLDLYEPTRDVLVALQPHLVPGSVLVFDEYANPLYPGETVAVREVMPDLRLRTNRYSQATDGMSYGVVGE